MTPPPGFDSYSKLASAELSFEAAPLEEDADLLRLAVLLDTHRYRFEWTLAGDRALASDLHVDVELEVSAKWFDEAQAAASACLERDGLDPFHDPERPLWRPRARQIDERFDPDRPLAGWVHFNAAGPTRGGQMPGRMAGL